MNLGRNDTPSPRRSYLDPNRNTPSFRLDLFMSVVAFVPAIDSMLLPNPPM